MKRILDPCSNRFGYDGWALHVRGAPKLLHWTLSTTRSEARQLKRELFSHRRDIDVVKAKVSLEAA